MPQDWSVRWIKMWTFVPLIVKVMNEALFWMTFFGKTSKYWGARGYWKGTHNCAKQTCLKSDILADFQISSAQRPWNFWLSSIFYVVVAVMNLFAFLTIQSSNLIEWAKIENLIFMQQLFGQSTFLFWVHTTRLKTLNFCNLYWLMIRHALFRCM